VVTLETRHWQRLGVKRPLSFRALFGDNGRAEPIIETRP
jgi:hypothetical protein